MCETTIGADGRLTIFLSDHLTASLEDSTDGPAHLTPDPIGRSQSKQLAQPDGDRRKADLGVGMRRLNGS